MSITPTLDLFDQNALERRALRIFASPVVQRELAATEALFAGAKAAETPDGCARLGLAARRFALAAAENVVIDDPVRPKIMWVLTQPHAWHGMDWPGSAWGSHNPDNFSRDLVIDGTSRYELHGQRIGPGPAQQTILVYDSFIGTQAQSLEGAGVIASLQDSDLQIAEDGSFVVTIGPEPATGPNHLQTRPDAKLIKIRNALEDWWTQVPNRIRVVRVAGPYAPPRGDDDLAEQAAALLRIQAPYWLQFNNERVYSAPANEPVLLGARQGGWGFISSGWFQFAPDEALVVTIDPLSAAYVGFQVTDGWTIPPDYIRHLAGLNKAQAKPNADGTYTFVVASRDPGVWNWVDTVGLQTGAFTIRWQRVADRNADPVAAIRASQVVKLGALDSVLPPGAVRVDAEGRRKQIEDRIASFALRREN